MPKSNSTNNYFIAGDWGTSNLRLYLCLQSSNKEFEIIESKLSVGVRDVDNNFEDVLFDLVQPWLNQHDKIPIILSGMVGSTIGWREAPYLDCPVDTKAIANGRLTFTCRGIEISILAGLKAHNPLGSLDVMRGEELQVLGCLQDQAIDKPNKQLFALPGTHNKWVLFDGQQIDTFLTAFTGELFSLLKDHSILITEATTEQQNPEAFIQGIDTINKGSTTNIHSPQLLHALFSTRSMQVLGELSPRDSTAYLSGLLIGADIIGAIDIFGGHYDPDLEVTVIADKALSDRYIQALSHLNIKACAVDSSKIAIAGYASVYKTLYHT